MGVFLVVFWSYFGRILAVVVDDQIVWGCTYVQLFYVILRGDQVVVEVVTTTK
jgi:hypothetical protein